MISGKNTEIVRGCIVGDIEKRVEIVCETYLNTWEKPKLDDSYLTAYVPANATHDEAVKLILEKYETKQEIYVPKEYREYIE